MKTISVHVSKEYDVVQRNWTEQISIQLHNSLLSNGLLTEIGDRNFRSLITIAMHTDSMGNCSANLKDLANTLGESLEVAHNRFEELCKFHWQGNPIIVKHKNTGSLEEVSYTVIHNHLNLPISLKVEDRYIKNDNLKDKEIGQDYLPENFPPKFSDEVAKIDNDIRVIYTYYRIALYAHQDIHKELFNSDNSTPIIHDQITAEAFRRSIGQYQLGKVRNLEGHFRNTLKRMLLKHYHSIHHKTEVGDKDSSITFYDWLHD